MLLLHYSSEKLQAEISDIVRKHYSGVATLFFFGSRVSHGKNDRSDIDVGILPEKTLSLQTIRAIKDDLNQIRMLYQIDFVDFSTVSEHFKSIALQQIESIN